MSGKRQLLRPFDVSSPIARKVIKLSRLESPGRISQLDSLTGLLTEEAFVARLGSEIERCKRHGRYFSVAIFDINKFKSLNQSYGYNVGDEILRLFARKVKDSMRSFDIIGRCGGDEFVVIMPEVSKHQATVPLNRILSMLDDVGFDTNSDDTLKLDISIGVVEFSVDGESVDDLMSNVRVSLAESKSAGKNRIAIFSRVV